MRTLLQIILTTSFLFIFSQVLMAQPEPPENSPIDGGLISLLLLGGGGALAAKKMRERKKRAE